MTDNSTRTAGQIVFSWLLKGFVALTCFFLIFPILAIVPISFSSGSFLSYPMPGVSLQWYQAVLEPFPWLESLWNSLFIAICATILATTLGTLAAYGLTVANFPGRGLIIAIIISPLIVPIIVVALGVYFLFAKVGLLGSFLGLILAHTALGAPFVVITVLATLQGFDMQLVRASASLGAKPMATFWQVTFPLITPGIVTGALFAFITSFDEVVVALFVASPAQFTLPRQMFAGLRDQLDPSIVAMSTLLIVFTCTILIVMEVLRRRTQRIMGGR